MKIYLDHVPFGEVAAYNIIPNTQIHFLNPNYHWDLVNTYNTNRVLVPVIHEYYCNELSGSALQLPNPPETNLTAIEPSVDQILLVYRFTQLLKGNDQWYYNFEWGVMTIPDDYILDDLYPLVGSHQEAVNCICKGLPEVLKNLL